MLAVARDIAAMGPAEDQPEYANPDLGIYLSETAPQWGRLKISRNTPVAKLGCASLVAAAMGPAEDQPEYRSASVQV